MKIEKIRSKIEHETGYTTTSRGDTIRVKAYNTKRLWSAQTITEVLKEEKVKKHLSYIAVDNGNIEYVIHNIVFKK